MSLIDCPECDGKVATSAKACPACGASIITVNGVEWSQLSMAYKLTVYSGYLLVCFALALGLVEFVGWVFSDVTIEFILPEGFYWWVLGLLTIGLYASLIHAFNRGEMNS
ncbi:hypothetical protein QCB45_09655 [Thiomicrorhabdus sp. ZW0627]|uniref:hypothetical protein n=1 Tax=Thiomicrorhabdus sp. ZW0627 TaxID=3039774 RepID=UPI00243685D5|nr:hypothetical protein [Thiomicrorhabdus sp. ZW0627]MDG6774598.1 hypothetical protein [Thiomicrorhabdus sp. ZW0627]